MLLGQVDQPTAGEVDLATALIRQEKWLDHVTDLVVAGREAWIDALHARGILAGWLDAGDERLAMQALYLLGRVSESRGEMIEALLLDRPRAKRREELERVLWMSSPDRLSPRLFKILVRFARRRSRGVLAVTKWKRLAEANALRCVQLFEASLLGTARRASVATAVSFRWACVN